MPLIYGILTNPVVGYERLAALMVARGLPYVQLRMKGASRDDILAVGRRLRRIVPAGFIVNDDPQLALEVEADGVHLGQGDPSAAYARDLLGPDAIIGLSTHSPAQLRAALAQAPTYVGVGPVFPTPTKAIPDPALGLDRMREMLQIAGNTPAVALGGLGLARAALVREAPMIAVVRYLNDTFAPEAALDALLAALSG